MTTPNPATTTDPWAGSTTAKERIRVLSGVSDPDRLDAMEATEGLQDSVARELERVRKLLAEFDDLAEAEDIADAIAQAEELRYKRAIVNRPGLIRRLEEVRAKLESRKQEERAEQEQPTDEDLARPTDRDEEPIEPAGEPPWHGALSIEDRVAIVRAATDLAALDALAASRPERPLQSRIVAEIAQQRAALTQVEEIADEGGARGALYALLGNRRTHARPGIVEAVRAKLEGFIDGEEEAPAIETRPLADLSVDELRELYEREVGRETGSVHRGYLTWKIREARKGRVTVGAVQSTRRRDPDVELKVVSLRFDKAAVDRLDEVIEGASEHASRLAFIRDAIAEKLDALGEEEAADAMRTA